LGFDEQMIIQLLFQWLNTFILCGVLTYVLYKPVKEFLRKRAERIKAEIDAAETAMKEAAGLKASYETKLKDIDKERAEILDAARLQAANKETQIVSAAKQEADTIKNRAMNDIDLERQKAKEEIKRQIIEVSALMAKKFVSANIDAKTQAQLIDEAIAELGDARWLS